MSLCHRFHVILSAERRREQQETLNCFAFNYKLRDSTFHDLIDIQHCFTLFYIVLQDGGRRNDCSNLH